MNLQWQEKIHQFTQKDIFHNLNRLDKRKRMSLPTSLINSPKKKYTMANVRPQNAYGKVNLQLLDCVL